MVKMVNFMLCGVFNHNKRYSPRHWCFLKVPQLISVCSQGWEPLIRLSLRAGPGHKPGQKKSWKVERKWGQVLYRHPLCPQRERLSSHPARRLTAHESFRWLPASYKWFSVHKRKNSSQRAVICLSRLLRNLSCQRRVVCCEIRLLDRLWLTPGQVWVKHGEALNLRVVSPSGQTTSGIASIYQDAQGRNLGTVLAPLFPHPSVR